MDVCESDIENNQYFSEKLIEKLDLKSSPVAIKLIINEEDIPEGIEKTNKKERHCQMVKDASKGEMFYSLSEEQTCKGGSAALGLEDFPEKITTGEFYYKLGRFKTVGSGKRTMDRIPKIDLRLHAIAYAPLEKATFQPDIIILIANPKQGMLISKAIVYTLGGRVEANFAGIQSVCADAVAGPFMTKNPNITLACSGSRAHAKVADDELIIGLNGENIGCTVNALVSMK